MHYICLCWVHGSLACTLNDVIRRSTGFTDTSLPPLTPKHRSFCLPPRPFHCSLTEILLCQITQLLKCPCTKANGQLKAPPKNGWEIQSLHFGLEARNAFIAGGPEKKAEWRCSSLKDFCNKKKMVFSQVYNNINLMAWILSFSKRE